MTAPETLSPEQITALNRAAHLLAVAAKAADLARNATLTRDDAIRQLRDAGVSLRAIGAAADLSHAAIAKIAAKGQS